MGEKSWSIIYQTRSYQQCVKNSKIYIPKKKKKYSKTEVNELNRQLSKKKYKWP